MSASFDDPEEFTGATQARKADPPREARQGARAVAAAAPIKVEAKTPGTPAAVYHAPKEGEAHPRIARKAVAERLDAAEVGLNLASLELQNATQHLRGCELVEADALDELTKMMPGPTYEEVNRERLTNIQAEKLRRVQDGLPPTEQPKPTHDNSPLGIAAFNRPRTSPQAANQPLRSPVVRRRV